MPEMIEPPTVMEFMTRDVHTVSPEFSLEEVINSLLKKKVSNAVVVVIQEGGVKHLMGFISERDCLEYLSNEIFYRNPKITAKSMMQPIPLCVSPETDLLTVATIFTQHGYRHLPVVRGKKLQGIVSRRDVLNGLMDYHRRCIAAECTARFPRDVHQIVNHRFILKP